MTVAAVIIVAVLVFFHDRQRQREFQLRQFQMQNDLPHEWKNSRLGPGRNGLVPAEEAVVF